MPRVTVEISKIEKCIWDFEETEILEILLKHIQDLPENQHLPKHEIFWNASFYVNIDGPYDIEATVIFEKIKRVEE